MKKLILVCLCLFLLTLPAFAAGEDGEDPDSVTVIEETELRSIPDVLVDLFGSYTPRTQTVTEILDDGSAVSYDQIVPGVAGLDWHWLSSVTLFGMFLYCVLRMIGGCMKWS